MHHRISDLMGACCCLPRESGNCCEISSGGFVRRFSTKEERKAQLEEYVNALEKELAGAREHLKDLK
jgi:hypothetical protein